MVYITDLTNLGNYEIMWVNTSGHTSDHVSYFVFDKNEGANKLPIVFSGNTFLNAGVGRWFEKNAYQDLVFSFWKMINMRGYTKVFPSSDLTFENVKFAYSQNRNNKEIAVHYNNLTEKIK